MQTESVGVLNGDDAFLADLLHCLSNELANLSVASGNRCGCSDLFLSLNFLRGGEQSLGHSLNSLLNAALEAQRVSASSHVAQALANQCLSQNGSGGGTVTCDVVSLLSNFLNELRTNLLVRILQLDFLRDRDTVVGDGGGAPRLLQHNVAAAGAKGHLHCIGEGVQTALKAAACLFVKSNELCHKCPPGRSDFSFTPAGAVHLNRVVSPPQRPRYGSAGKVGHKAPECYINCGTRAGMEQTFKPKVEGLIAQCLICAH